MAVKPGNEEASKTLPPRADYSEWYSEVLMAAEILDVRYPVKGMYVWYPYGYALRNRIYAILRGLLDHDHDEVQFPLLVPENELAKEGQHIKGFEDEVYWVTRGGSTPLEVPLALRPTSETAMYPIFKLWIRSHADLPLRVYQIVNTFRYETRHTRPMIRSREITSFKEAHTVHATWEDADAQVKAAVRLYGEFFKTLGVPVVVCRRPDWDKFPGADYTAAFDTMMPDGKSLQVGTVHHLGDNFAKTFEITYEDETGEQQYAHQTCYGISERCVAAPIGIHGDDKGLVLPPAVAPVQVVIVPIVFGERAPMLDAANELREELENGGIRAKVDGRDMRPGAKYYWWELRGVPMRIELGPKELEKGHVTVVWRTGEKRKIEREGVARNVRAELDMVQESLCASANDAFVKNIRDCKSTSEITSAVETGFAQLEWCGDDACAHAAEDAADATLLGERLDVETPSGKCAACGRTSKKRLLLARSY